MLRAPTPEDVSALGRLHAETWHDAYTGLLPDWVLAEITVERSTAYWARVLNGELPAERRVLVAAQEETGTPIGFAFTGPCRDAEPVGAGELYAIYVSAAHWGRGAGPELIEGAHETLRDAGFEEAVLWVLTGNDRACRFYQRHGWRTDGVEMIKDVHDCPVPEIRYRRSLRNE